jgi:secreted trypsin-like serine protease
MRSLRCLLALGAVPLMACAPAAAARLSPRVVGGRSVPITAYPFQVALWSPRAPSPYDGFFCGA